MPLPNLKITFENVGNCLDCQALFPPDSFWKHFTHDLADVLNSNEFILTPWETGTWKYEEVGDFGKAQYFLDNGCNNLDHEDDLVKLIVWSRPSTILVSANFYNAGGNSRGWAFSGERELAPPKIAINPSTLKVLFNPVTKKSILISPCTEHLCKDIPNDYDWSTCSYANWCCRSGTASMEEQ